MTQTQRTGHHVSCSDAEGRLVPGVHWPVPAFALAALADMGMSDDLIARYFGITAAEVRLERERMLR